MVSVTLCDKSTGFADILYFVIGSGAGTILETVVMDFKHICKWEITRNVNPSSTNNTIRSKHIKGIAIYANTKEVL